MKKLLYLILVGMIVFINAQGITNTLGGNTSTDKFIVENSDAEAGLVVDGKGKVGIGVDSPSGYPELHIKNNDANNELIRLESSNGTVWTIDVSESQIRFSDDNDNHHLVIDKDEDRIFFTGELQQPASTGGANLIPIAYGSINSDGTIRSGTENFSCAWSTNDQKYIIYFDYYSYNDNYITVVTPRGTATAIPLTRSYLNALDIDFHNLAGNTVQSYFQFITYKP
jgi:hypothetical protein